MDADDWTWIDVAKIATVLVGGYLLGWVILYAGYFLILFLPVILIGEWLWRTFWKSGPKSD